MIRIETKGGWEPELWRAGRLECAGWAPAEPSIEAGLTSETGNLSRMLHHLPHGVLPLSSPPHRSLWPSPLLSPPLIQDLSASTTSCCQFIILWPRLAAPGAKCTQPSIHSHSFIILPVHVCACLCMCVCVRVSVCARTCGFQCVCVKMCAPQRVHYAQPVLSLHLSYCFEWVGGIMGAIAMRLGGNKVRLSNLFRRHCLLWESGRPPHSTTSTPISHPSQAKISQQASVKGSVV